jgi:hypothetical protein
MQVRLAIFCCVVSIICDVPIVLGQEMKCGGEVYRAKSEGVVVYEEPDTTSSVKRKLRLGEKVCIIGQQRNFGILAASDDRGVEFARMVDLWPPRWGRIGRPRAPVDEIKERFRYMRQGIVPENPSFPYRPFIELFKGSESGNIAPSSGSDCPTDETRSSISSSTSSQ